MIAYLEGKIAYKDPTFLVIDVNGVGYQVKISLNTWSVIKNLDKCLIHTWLQVKEDAHVLFGFSDVVEKKLFLDLISVSGVGPSIALAILSSMTPEETKEAILTDQANVIQAVKGVGAKTAQRIVLELKDKLKRDSIEKVYDTAPVLHNTIKNEALSALITLGFNKAVAEKTLENILKKSSKDITLEELIKLSLKSS